MINFSTIMENLVTPIQEKSEDWKKSVAQLDKEHAKGIYRNLCDIYPLIGKPHKYMYKYVTQVLVFTTGHVSTADSLMFTMISINL